MTPADRTRALIADTAAEHGLTASAMLARHARGTAQAARRTLYRRLQARGLSTNRIGTIVGRDGSTVRGALRAMTLVDDRVSGYVAGQMGAGA